MYDIAGQIAQWLEERGDGGVRRDIHVAQVVATRGFSSSNPSAALAWTDDGTVTGALLPGVDDDLRAGGAVLDGRLVEVTISDDDAVAAGLSCGGVATVIVQNAAAFPPGLWDRLERREPVCLISEIDGEALAQTTVFTPADIRTVVQRPGAEGVPRLFARGTSTTDLVLSGDSSLAVVALWPSTDLLVVGSGTIADALAEVGTLLGWTSMITNEVAAATDLATTLTPSDAVVVLSHDREVDVPALAAALAGRVGYVGALGSRPTQAARRAGLTERDVSTDVIDRIHGPAGLDVDAHTPGEIAISIVAEILANRAGTSGGSISERPGPIHTAGVSAPPPRY